MTVARRPPLCRRALTRCPCRLPLSCHCLQARNQLAVVRGSEYTLIKSRFDELYARQRISNLLHL